MRDRETLIIETDDKQRFNKMIQSRNNGCFYSLYHQLWTIDSWEERSHSFVGSFYVIKLIKS